MYRKIPSPTWPKTKVESAVKEVEVERERRKKRRERGRENAGSCQDLNLDLEIQSLACCHYTTGPASRWALEKLPYQGLLWCSNSHSDHTHKRGILGFCV